jgi:predicted DNA-binding transcriptional regulator AlpA
MMSYQGICLQPAAPLAPSPLCDEIDGCHKTRSNFKKLTRPTRLIDIRLTETFETGGKTMSNAESRNGIGLLGHGTFSTQLDRKEEQLLNARQVADRLGVSERWVRDHTTRRFPKIRGIKLGPLVRYRRADVEVFMAELDTQPPSPRARFDV